MKTRGLAILSMLLFCLTVSVDAQLPEFELTLRATWIDSVGSSPEFEDLEQDFIAEFDSDTGFGVGINAYLTDAVSAEFTATLVEPDLEVTLFGDDGPRSGPALEMIPLTLGLQYHVRPVRWMNLYAGGGVAYIVFDDVDLGGLDQFDVESIEVDDEVGFMANIGVTFEVIRNLGINLDARYLGVEPDATVSFDRGDFVADRTIEFNPLMLSAGLSWKF